MSQNPVYSFPEQLERGQRWEGVLDEYFQEWYDTFEATRDEQRRGIDRHFSYPGENRPPVTVEYKADDKTSDTGNVFIETESVVEKDKPGWAWKSEAEILVYLAIPDTIYIAKMDKVREMIPTWRRVYGTRRVRNEYWTSRGIPVPEDVFESACIKVRRLY